MNELKVISITNGIIETNFEEFHAGLKKAVEDYKGLVVTEDNLKDMKGTRKELTAGVKIINKERIKNKKLYLAPLTEYEDNCKQAIATIEVAETELKDKINVYDERVRQEHLHYANEIKTLMVADLSLDSKRSERIDTIKNFANLTCKLKDIKLDITAQADEQKALQTTETSNVAYVANQLVTASKLADLSTPLVIEDISHLISDYETMDVVAVTNGINDVAMRRKEAEELAVKQAEERIRREEQAKAEAKERAARELILAEEREAARLRTEAEREVERLKRLDHERENAEQLAAEAKVAAEEDKVPFFEEEEEEEEEEEPLEFVRFDNENGFVSIEDADKHLRDVIIRVTCKENEVIDVIRLLAINKFDCEVER